jgi:Sulfatase
MKSSKSVGAGKKPNIVFILTDNLGYGELGVYGGGILRGAPTPRIDKLASEGMRLLNFNVEAQCTPCRSALMTGRFAIRSGTYEVPIGGAPDGLTQWETTIAQLLSAQGYATGMWGKWHLGSTEGRFPTNFGFDEWYGIPRSYDECLWPSLNETNSMWPSVGSKQGWNAELAHPEPIYEARKGEKASVVAELNVDLRRTMEAEITNRAVDFIKRNASADKPFYAYISSSMVHLRCCQVRRSLERPVTAIGRIVWPRWTTAPDKFLMRSRKPASKTTQSSFSPATMALRRSTHGRATAVRGGVPISRRWKLPYAFRSLSVGRAMYRQAALATRSFTSWTCSQRSPVQVGQRSRRTDRSTGWTNRISSWANRRTLTARGSPSMWPTDCLRSSGAIGRCTSSGR